MKIFDYTDSPFEKHIHESSPLLQQTSLSVSYEQDVEYMRKLLPSFVSDIQKEIDEECDKLEYEGSVMFDEYPDSSHLNMIIDSVVSRIDAENTDIAASELNSYPTQPYHHGGPPPWPPYGPGGPPPWPPYGPGGPPPPPPRPCFGPYCPIINRPCGPGRYCPPPPCPTCHPGGRPNWLRTLVGSMLLNEMTFRRNRYRSRRF
ncbi:hypothetical protein [Anaeromicropila populeti]|uniref:Uncharacterized protein n=1 Tax=Anaeromicropila populeti TaxID=37658 RepID=A0A1I6I882_9FIRM|nr:hypothetical protein [Anaeromicropila populeti]SFR62923.1 hypothetical protein SAMN05661086_00537 [Anaeromicropila populeti]